MYANSQNVVVLPWRKAAARPSDNAGEGLHASLAGPHALAREHENKAGEPLGSGSPARRVHSAMLPMIGVDEKMFREERR